MNQRARTEEPADVAVWRRHADDGRAWYSFTVSRSYMDRDDKWQRTASLDEDDLLPAAKALERAYDWVQQQRQTARDAGLKDLRGPAAPGPVS